AMDSALAVGVVTDPINPPGAWQRADGPIGVVDLGGPIPQPGEYAGLRVFAGYAGWSAGQLESEIDEGAWLVLTAEVDDLVSPVPERLWSEVLRRQKGETRFWSTLPADP